MKIQDTEDINAKSNENKSYQWKEKQRSYLHLKCMKKKSE